MQIGLNQAKCFCRGGRLFSNKACPGHDRNRALALCFDSPATLVAANGARVSIEGWAAASIGKGHAVGAAVVPTTDDNASTVVLDRIDTTEAFLAGGIHEVAPAAAATVTITITVPPWAIPVLILPTIPPWRLPVSVVIAKILRHGDRWHQLCCGQAGQRNESNSCKTFKHPSLLAVILVAWMGDIAF
jgi:hypothetical protein